MRILSTFFVLFILSGCQQKQSYLISVDAIPSHEKHILLMYPTVNNVRTFKYLVNNKIFNLPQEYKVIGVFHSLEKYDFSKTEEFISKEGIANISLVKIDAQLTPENIYKQNEGSDIFKKLFDNSNGAIFFGGPDIPPICYGENTSLLTTITDPFRHYMEISFLFHLIGGNQDTTCVPFLKSRPDYPILGICLGMQSINVATGGTLYQDIPSELYNQKSVEEVLCSSQNQQHRNYQSDYSLDSNVTYYYYHQIAIEKNSPLSKYISGDTIHPYVWSSHHQSINKLGKGLRISAKSMDGKIVESVVHSKYPNILGVQFHPEKKELYNSNDKIRIVPLESAKFSYLDLYNGDKGENFQRSIWREFAAKFK
jgi:putative glutamine amidotransferase